MKKLLALLMIWLLLPIAGAEETYTMQDGSLILLDGVGRKCQPIAMKPDFPEALLADADISGAIQLNLPETLLPYVSDELTGGETLVELYCTTELIAMHTVDAADGDVLRVAYRTNLGNYVIRKVIGTPFFFDRYHGGVASILLCVDEITYCMTCENGYLTLREVWNGAGGIGIKRHAIYDLQACVESAGGNAGFRYGNHPYSDVTHLPFADFPTTYEEAMQHLDRTNWAVVNNPNPADRLYLRGKAQFRQVLQPNARVCGGNPRRLGACHHRARPLWLDADGLSGVRRGYGQSGVCVPAVDCQGRASGVWGGRICLRIPRVRCAGLVGGHDALEQHGKLLPHRRVRGVLHHHEQRRSDWLYPAGLALGGQRVRGECQ